MVSSLGDPEGERTKVFAEPRAWARGHVALADLQPCLTAHGSTEPAIGGVDEERPNKVELVVRTIAQTAVDNEKYFGDLDAVVGDGDFGYSMARGFEIVLADWDRSTARDIGTFLKKIAVVDHQPGRRYVRPDLGNRVPASGSGGGGQDRAHRRTTRRDAASRDRGGHEAR